MQKLNVHLSEDVLHKINNKVHFIEIGCIVIVGLPPWGDQENLMYVHSAFSIKDLISGLRQFQTIESRLENEKCFLFHVKSSFRYWALHSCPDFLAMQKNGLIRKLWFTSKFIMS